MDTTIHDIAKLAGVSKSTVSRALSDSGLVSEKTRQKVLKSAELLNYKPNAIARAMVTKKTGNIGFVIYQKHKPVISHPFYSHILESIVDETNSIGYNLFISSDQDIRISSGEILMQKKVDGVILASRVDKKIVVNFRKQGIPVVVINNIVDLDDVFCIVNDDFNGAMEAVEYLIGKGHRKIGILCGPLEHISYSQRYNGYINALKKYEINLDYQLIKITDSTLQHGYDAMEAILAVGNIPTAVFCTNDMMAIGAMKAIKHAGYRIPEDIAVAGFDDIEFSSLVEPALTTVFSDKTAIGKTAVEKLKRMIDNQPVDEFIVKQETKLVIREST
jgi:DNA-binding LacI/PurR family transcriptional regulator